MGFVRVRDAQATLTAHQLHAVVMGCVMVVKPVQHVYLTADPAICPWEDFTQLPHVQVQEQT